MASRRPWWWWSRKVFGAVLCLSSVAGLLGLPADIRTWYGCLGAGTGCESIRAAMPSGVALPTGWDAWRLLYLLGVALGLVLLFLPTTKVKDETPRTRQRTPAERLSEMEEEDLKLYKVHRAAEIARVQHATMAIPPVQKLLSLYRHGQGLLRLVSGLGMDAHSHSDVVKYQQATTDVKNWRFGVVEVLEKEVGAVQARFFINCPGGLGLRGQLECHLQRLGQIIHELDSSISLT